MEQHQLLGRLSGLVDHLRGGDDEKLSLADVASVTEVLIATMDSYFRSIDTSIYRECRSLSDYISNARLEIAALSPKDLENARIPRAGLELDAIVQQTEEATNTIMTAAEEILGGLGSDMEENRDSIEAAVMQIFEACSFQDITGQRISKVVSTLSHIEQRVKDLRDLMGVTDEHIEAAQTDSTSPGAHSSDALAQGPSLEGEGIDQSEVDSLLGGEAAEKTDAGQEEAGQDDIDALMAEDDGEASQDDIDALLADDGTSEPEPEPEPEEAPEAAAAPEPEPEPEPEEAPEAAAAPDAAPANGVEEEAGDAEPEGEENAALEVKGRTTSQEEIDSLFN